ncbi:DUF2235 domain-containing protein [Marinobacter caseinilyticus]|uniref:DUF2235 domain-containing protein n=1 Tax=Marinobacter caseinilyticus TaxID=2692195 RepID=UPI001408C225|nr:DUF2235 domain-containing protein [Marinobacter caseinilyticus]
MKRIAIFSDGTWNDPENSHPTNVIHMARAVRPQAPDGTEQVAFYDWGVGTDRKRIAGGISGAGIDKNIMDCYRFLVHNYEAGDPLFFFGFSRGSYTVRSLAGFIRNCGLIKREHAERIPEAFQLYRKRTRASSPDEQMPILFRSQFAVANITPIEFVGVWDTVGALGIPVPFWGTLGEREFLFHDTEPSKIVQHARHAVSIDENRKDFEPTLWDLKPGLDLKQVWFAGVHSDVGGGYRHNGLSTVALDWMIREASAAGLVFESHMLNTVKARLQASPETDRGHNERKGIYLARPESVRSIQGPIHRSVRLRWDNDAHGYRTKSKALRQRLDSVSGDWSRLDIVD